MRSWHSRLCLLTVIGAKIVIDRTVLNCGLMRNKVWYGSGYWHAYDLTVTVVAKLVFYALCGGRQLGANRRNSDLLIDHEEFELISPINQS